MDPVLVATDLSARSDRAVTRAAHVAKARGAELHILHVADDDLPAAILQRRSEEAEAVLATMVEGTDALAGLSPKLHVEVGDIAPLVAKTANAAEAGLIVLGSHRGRGLGELLGAPTLTRIMRAVERPILIAVGRPDKAYGKVMVGWDHSSASRKAFDLARDVAPEAAVELLHAWHDPYLAGPYGFDMGAVSSAAGREWADQMRDAVKELQMDGATVTGEAAVGAPAPALLRHAEETSADLIAVGRHARSGVARFLLGETAIRAAMHATCDVLIAPPV